MYEFIDRQLLVLMQAEYAGPMLNRALFALESAWHVHFKAHMLASTAWLPHDDGMNSLMFAALQRRVHSLARQGVHRTALEWAKLTLVRRLTRSSFACLRSVHITPGYGRDYLHTDCWLQLQHVCCGGATCCGGDQPHARMLHMARLLMQGLDTDDPCGMLFHIDYFCLRARECASHLLGRAGVLASHSWMHLPSSPSRHLTCLMPPW